jgi:sugar lactone lactonase YvrE
MQRLRIVAPLLVVLGLLLTACQPAPTPLAATPAVATQAAQPTLTTLPAATATVAASPTAAPTAVPSAATATADAGVLATQYRLDSPWGVAVEASGKLYVSTCMGDAVPLLAIDAAGMLKSYAGVQGFGFGGDGGPALAANFACPGGLALGPDGNLYVADQGNNRIRRIDKNGTISTVAGSGPGPDTTSLYCCVGSFAGDGGPATAARLWNPTDVAFDRQGSLYIADHNNNRVRKVDSQGVITTVAGNGTAGFAGDGGPATDAQLNTETGVSKPDLGGPMNIAVDAEGNLYIGDSGNARVRKVVATGGITTIAGTGENGFSGDGGPATAAQVSSPSGLAFDAEGSLYIADNGNRIRKIDKAGLITTIAGTGENGYSGDGGLATKAALNGPASIIFDPQGNLYFVDSVNSRVRKIDKSGIITTVAGGGF